MASVFLSYDRDDAERARPLALAVEKAGHSVWWDLHVRGGAQFSKVIEEALKAADAVVVVWSKNSVESAWVRDEAAAGRDSGRLIPVSLDHTQPPLGFRQFQTIDLIDWKRGARGRGYRELLQAINEIAGEAPVIAAASAGSTQPPFLSRFIRRRWFAIAAFALVLLTTGLAAWRYSQKPATVPTVAVVPADHSAAARALARDLLVKLGTLSSAKVRSLRMTGEEQANRADLVFQIGSDSSYTPPAASLMLLTGKTKSVLWSKSFEEHSGNAADLRQQTAFTAARVLGCTLDGLRPKAKRLPEAVLQQYLNACALLEELWDHDPDPPIRLLEQVTMQAPGFEPAWAKLLIAETYRYQTLTASERSGAAAGLRRQIVRARKINPKMPETYIAEIELLPGGAFFEQVKLANLAVHADPENVAALSGRSLVFQGLGRQDDAVNDARRAAELDPLSPATRNAYIQALTYSGQTDAAKQELAKAEKLWPGASTITEARYRFSMRAGDPRDALELMRSGKVAYGPEQGGPAREAFLRARIDPSEQNVAQALDLVRTSYRRSPEAVGDLLQVLGEFHQTNELLDVLLNWNDPSDMPYFVEVLFRPALADLRADPRFMRLASRFGLLDYWRTSGKWPDFCFEPDLPYDCKKEAAKLNA